ncbi:plasmid mobilization relaxosome protein MobC [Pedobacter sp. V48]|uniref:plasmid mobilization relaxosome protein MobC n=1 Tax=Pedobacter sp. V48 TaxID=509635 RepID=UPI000A06E026|nr:plasmid mobilization relaxosome protein MobC [Pedobacter sp. V48]
MWVLNRSSAMVINAKALMDHDLVGAELGRTGNNINQLARYANWGLFHRPPPSLNVATYEIIPTNTLRQPEIKSRESPVIPGFLVD